MYIGELSPWIFTKPPEAGLGQPHFAEEETEM